MASVQALRLAHDEALRRLCKENLHFFVKTFWDTLEGVDFEDNWHIQAICEHLEGVACGKIKNLMLLIPPRHMKSSIVSIFFPVWVWLQNPSSKLISASATMNLSIGFTKQSMTLIESPKFMHLFGDRFEKNPKSWGVKTYGNDKNGVRHAITVAGGTGLTANIFIIDDPIEAENSRSQAYRDQCWTWYTGTAKTRLVKNGATILVMQRLHEEDLVGKILASERRKKMWDILCFPVEYEVDHVVKTQSSLGFQDPRTYEGELLWERMYGQDWVEDRKDEMTPQVVAAQLQQRPSPKDGEIFKEYMFPFADVDVNAIINISTEIVLSVDATFNDSKTSDNVAIIVFARYKGEWYCVNGINKQMDFLATLASIKQMMNEYKPHSLIIEKKANGDAIIRTLRQAGIDNVLAITPKESKEARAESSTIYLTQGSVKFIKTPFVAQLIEQAIAFPNAKHDDMVDALTQFINAKLNRRQSDVQGISIGF
jgi:predicted phage terminase large subunit-like protein